MRYNNVTAKFSTEKESDTILLLTKRLKGQLHLFVPGKRQSLEFFLFVQRKHLNQDPFGLQSANCNTKTKTSCFFFCCHFIYKISLSSVYPICQHQTIPFCQKSVVVNKHRRDLFATKLKNLTFEWHEKARLHFMPRFSLSELNFPNQINRQLNFLQQGQGNNSGEPAHCTQCTVYSNNSHCLKQSD